MTTPVPSPAASTVASPRLTALLPLALVGLVATATLALTPGPRLGDSAPAVPEETMVGQVHR